MNSDRLGFLAAIRHDPDADAPRLIYADWLDEHGEPDHAAFIRHSCYAADVDRPMVERVGHHRIGAGLFRRIEASWKRDFPACENLSAARGAVKPGRIASSGYDATLQRLADRELVTSLSLELAQANRWPREILGRFPHLELEARSFAEAAVSLDLLGTQNVHRLELDMRPRAGITRGNLLDAAPDLSRVAELRVSAYELRPADGEVALFARRLSGLRRLHYADWDPSQRTLPDFLKNLPNQRLDVFGGPPPGPAQVNQIMAWDGAASVRRFDFVLETADVTRAFFATPWLSKYQDAPRFEGRVLEPGEWIANSRLLAPQSMLYWRSPGGHDSALHAFLTPSLKSLHMFLGAGVSASSPLRDAMPRMDPEHVSLWGQGFDTELLCAWLVGPNGTGSPIDWSNCRTLSIAGTGISKRVVSALAECPTLTGLDLLSLDCDYLGPDALMPVLSSPKFASTCVGVRTELVLPPDLSRRFPNLDAGSRHRPPTSRCRGLGSYGP